MNESRTGLKLIYPDRKDFSLIHTFGSTVPDDAGLPTTFSIYDGRPIPNQMLPDLRFTPPARALPFGCVAETLTFDEGLKTKSTLNPDDFYVSVPPYTYDEGRDIRLALKTAIDRGFKKEDGTFEKELAYFNCYGSGMIDDFDAARFGLWINQNEPRGIIIGSWWYQAFMDSPLGYFPLPSFNTKEASLHCYLGTGFESTYKDDYLEVIPWIGQNWGAKGVGYVSREIFNALMSQPYTGAFTITNKPSNSPVPVGVQAEIDHFIYYFRNKFNL